MKMKGTNVDFFFYNPPLRIAIWTASNMVAHTATYD